ncbi:MAG: sortase [Ruminococcaceae bacterium]|nr:sortase [Oscillospiraceae bacterium]
MKKVSLIIRILGVALILVSLGILLFNLIHTEQMGKKNAAVVTQLQGLMPPARQGNPQDYDQQEMPALELDGVDYVCLLEVPSQGVTLPVQSQWDTNALKSRPCKFWGSIYNGNCILGGSGSQFDFCAKLDLGDSILLTDMEGTVFTCYVQRIDRSSTANFDRLSQGDFPLTLFVRQEYASEYIIVRCGWNR